MLHLSVPAFFVAGPFYSIFGFATLAVFGLACLAVGIAQSIWSRSSAILWFLLPVAVTHLFLQVVGIWRLGVNSHTAPVMIFFGIALLGAIGMAAFSAQMNALAAFAMSLFSLMYAATAFFAVGFLLSFG